MKTKSWIVGREASADISIADPSVSREHAEVSMEAGGTLLVVDRGSSNGTYVVRQGTVTRIQTSAVHSQDQVRFGAVTIQAADLMAAIQKKQSAAKPAAAASRTSVRLIRCACGAVKESGGACNACGQA